MSYRRSNLAQAALTPALGLVALALLGFVLAYWSWAWFGPRAAPRSGTSDEPAGRIASAGNLFGKAAPGEGAGARTGQAIRLLGVVAAKGDKPGLAIVKIDAREIVAVREGENIAPGIRLERVFADHVTLVRDGAQETLAWAKPGTPALPPTPGALK